MKRTKQEYIPYKVLYTFEDRKHKYKETLQNFIKKSKIDVVLIILQPHPKSNLPLLDHCTFACESFSTLTYLRQQICRKKLKLNQNFSLFLYTGKKVLIGDQTLAKIRSQYADQDGFLYITYAEMDVY